MRLPWRDVPLGSGTISTSLTPREAQRLHDLAANNRVLEIGSAYGYSAIRMAAMADSVLAVDPHAGEVPNSLATMRTNVDAYGHGKVSILVATSQQALPMLRAIGARFDMVFIDGDHSPYGVMHDVVAAWEVLVDGAVICCHDYGEETCPGVVAALDDVYSDGPDVLVDTLWIKRHRAFR